jgi:glycerophosphoryl diester phosphodiesterase
MILILVLILIFALIAFLIAPSAKCRRAESWRGVPFAHRGLHNGERMENSFEAFEAACKHGFGIELDVQLTKDGQPIIFHDDTLLRMTGDSRRVDEVPLSELRALSLKGKGSIPTLEEALRCVRGRTPLLVEIKNGKRNAELCEKTMAQLRAYNGKYVVESFNPLILVWLKKYSPETIRGQLVNERISYLATTSPIIAFVLSRLLLNFLARPDFVAYNIEVKNFSAPKIQRAFFHTPLAAWTVRDEKTYRECIARGESPIFENFIP